MSVYAPIAPYAEGRRHPRALIMIVTGHAALLAAVMTAKMDLPGRLVPTITKVTLIDELKPPPDNPPPRPADPHAGRVDQLRPEVPAPIPSLPAFDPTPLPLPDPGVASGAGASATSAMPVPNPAPARVAARFITPEWDLKPPYPQDKLRLQEEAVLRLRLTIDDRGRVTAVEPVGTTDPIFLATARRHLLARWRYRPATENGQPVASTTVITLHFQLDD